jgi:hypothetical protein
VRGPWQQERGGQREYQAGDEEGGSRHHAPAG